MLKGEQVRRIVEIRDQTVSFSLNGLVLELDFLTKKRLSVRRLAPGQSWNVEIAFRKLLPGTSLVIFPNS